MILLYSVIIFFSNKKALLKKSSFIDPRRSTGILPLKKYRWVVASLVHGPNQYRLPYAVLL